MRLINVLKKIRLMVGDHKTVVQHDDPFRVLVSTILSQRTRDENTSIASRNLFSKFRTAELISKARVSEIELLIKQAGFYKVKARRIKEVAKQVVKHGMPDGFEGLMSLPGVGRKTANCVLVYGYGKPAIPVDTHVHRVMNRLGIVKTKNPEQTEKELMKLLPRNHWLGVNDLLVKFGQQICKPVKPLCNEKKCVLRSVCYYYINYLKQK